MLQMSTSRVTRIDLSGVTEVGSPAEILRLREQVRSTTVMPDVARYVAGIVRQTRQLPAVALGASPRAAVHLLAASKASARLSGRDFVTPDDVAGLAHPVLRHRILVRPEAELERFRPDDAVAAALASVPVPR